MISQTGLVSKLQNGLDVSVIIVFVHFLFSIRSLLGLFSIYNYLTTLSLSQFSWDFSAIFPLGLGSLVPFLS